MSLKLLIADDDEGYLRPMVDLFEDFGYTVKQATDKEGVLSQASDADIWIIDARLPTEKNEGISAVKELVAKEILPKYPVIFISVLPKDFAEGDLKELEMIKYHWLEKPFELEYLLNIVKKLVKEVVK